VEVHRFLISPRNVHGSTITVDDPQELHHLRVVLRLTRGDRVCCFDGGGMEYVGTITRSSPRQLAVAIQTQVRAAEEHPRIWLAHSLIKGPRVDWVLQKATELGVARLTPLLTERTVIRLSEEESRKKTARWNRIIQEAAKQCGRSTLPILDSPQPFGSLLPSLNRVPLVLLPTLTIEAKPLRDELRAVSGITEVAVLIGPEGDFSLEEIQQAIKHGAHPVSLGRLTLRTETAALSTLAILHYALGTP
jgi:16S rRNA (uracil1498-N3)-methyltransferase